MTASFTQLLLFLFAGIIIIVILTTWYRVHAFSALMIASLVVGLGVQLPPAEIITTINEGFGNVTILMGLVSFLSVWPPSFFLL
jgi:GntP family gluconate:H+ symporter